MAIIQCPECQKEISDQASQCPQCGFPIKKETIPSPLPAPSNAALSSSAVSAKSKTAIIGGIVAVGVAVVGLWLYFWGGSAPGCADASVKETVLEIVKEQLLTEIFDKERADQINLQLDLVHTVSKDTAAGSYICSAQMLMSDERGREMKTFINYSSSKAEKWGEFVVTVEFDNPLDGITMQETF